MEEIQNVPHSSQHEVRVKYESLKSDGKTLSESGWQHSCSGAFNCRESCLSNKHSHIISPHPDIYGDETICFRSGCLVFQAGIVDNLELWVTRNPFCQSCFLLGYFVSAREKNQIDTGAKELGSWPYDGFYIFWLFFESIWYILLEILLNNGSITYDYSREIMEISVQRKMQKWRSWSLRFREE